MKRRLLSVCLLLSVLGAILPAEVRAAQYVPPWAHVQYIADSYKLSWGAGFLTGAGYQTYCQSTLSSYAHYTNLKSDAAYIWDGHGVQWNDGSVGGGYVVSDLAGDNMILASGGSNAYPIYYVSNYAAHGDIDDVLLFMLIGCYTAVDHAQLGALTGWARARGVDTAIGWPGLLNIGTSPAFGMGFMKGARYYPGKAIDCPQGCNAEMDQDLMQYALDYAQTNCPGADPLEFQRLVLWETQGWSSQTMQPAHYGNP